MMLDHAMQHIKSVPYKVPLRWLFYRLLQDGIYSKKGDYKNKFVGMISQARHNYIGEWRPDTLVDKSRSILLKGLGSLTEDDAINDIKINLDKFQNQDNIILLVFEAKAMLGQFEHYTKHIPLIPFGGDPSIPLKWDTAMAVYGLSKRYNKPVKMLYFGDADEKGNEIWKNAFIDIKRWCPVDFEFIYCGLTVDQAKEYGVPENPDKPSQYQWEALRDKQAEEIINTEVTKHYTIERIREVEVTEKELLKAWKEKLRG